MNTTEELNYLEYLANDPYEYLAGRDYRECNEPDPIEEMLFEEAQQRH